MSLALLLAAAACTGGGEEAWTARVEGSEGAICGYRTPVGVSPDSRFLLFEHETEGLVVLDRSAGVRTPPVPTPEARERLEGGRPPDLLTLCWAGDGSEAVLQGSRIPTMDPARPRISNVFSLSLVASPPTLEARASTDCATRPGRAWDLWTEGRPVAPGSGHPEGVPDRAPPDPVVTRGSRVVQGAGASRARILGPGGELLAEVSPPRFAPLGGQAGIMAYAWSPDGTRLAWVSLRSRLGSWGGQYRLHLREADGTVRALGPARPRGMEIVWASDTELLACLRDDPGHLVRVLP